jgi:hypothetical protein
MGDRVKAVKCHQLAHLLEENGWTGAARDVAESLIEEQYRLDVIGHVHQRLQQSHWL